ncbi:hypothetical protein ACWDYH_36315 [Nocardia goodfellowii]
MSSDFRKSEYLPNPIEPDTQPGSDIETMTGREGVPSAPDTETPGQDLIPSSSGNAAALTDSQRMLEIEDQFGQSWTVHTAGRSVSAGTADAYQATLPRGPDSTQTAEAVSPHSAAPDTVTEQEPRGYEGSIEPDVLQACTKWKVETAEGVQAVQRSYEVVKDKVAPFLVKHVATMLEDCKAEVAADPSHIYAFLGRDGYPLATIVATLDNQFFTEHCRLLPVTRRMVEAALQDEERSSGKDFDLTPYRKYQGEITPEESDGAKADLTELLEACGAPVGEPGRAITVFDTSRKGSTQVGLTALYPEIVWFGRYLCLERLDCDPNPEMKTGYALDSTVDSSLERTAGETLHQSRAMTFAHSDAILAVEDLLHGPWSSRLRAGTEQHAEVPSEAELNPLEISAAFRDPATRLAAAEVMVLAVRDSAVEWSELRERAPDWRAQLDQRADEFVDELRRWITGGDCDPALAEIRGSFVRRTDRAHVAELRSAIADSGLDDFETEAVWRGFQQAGSVEAKGAYVADYNHRMTLP